MAPKDVQKPAAGSKSKPEDKPDADLSDEDLQLKQNLDMLVSKLQDPDAGIQSLALDKICSEIRTATSSMTSVPKPLKFLRAHTEALVARFEELPDGANKLHLADILSVLSTTSAKEGARLTLHYKLKGTKEDLGSWGHEYLRHLAGEIGEEFKARAEKDAATEDLMQLVSLIVPFHLSHNAEPEAVDLLLEVEKLDMLKDLVDDKNFARTCLYLVSCSSYLSEPDDMTVLEVAYDIYIKMHRYHDAMRVALKINKRQLIEDVFVACTDVLHKKQLCYLLGRQGFILDLEEGKCEVDDNDLRESLRNIMTNSMLFEHYTGLAKDLDVMEPKSPEDVYKTHLTDSRTPSGPAVDSARQNLASTFVNAFVNAAFGKDKLLTAETDTGSTDSVHWIFKNKDHGKTSATASLGMITQWDVEGGLSQIDKYLYYSDNYVVAGALIAIGIVNCCVQHENDPAFALVQEYVSNLDQTIRLGAIFGLGLAYAGTCRANVLETLVPLVLDTEVNMEVSGMAALSLGLVFTSTCNDEITQAVLAALLARSEADLTSPFAKYLCLCLGLLFLGKQDIVEATVEVAKTLNEKISMFCQVTLDSFAYAGTGNVLKVQELLHMCGQHIEVEESQDWKAAHQAPAVMGIGLIAMSEPLGVSMALRTLEQLLQYCDPPVRRAVPLSLAILNVSAPDLQVMDTLSRLTHDADIEVAQNAVLALGIIGAGTNNARLAGMLRNLASYYYKEPTLLFLVRVAQGVVHMGKGLMTLNPYHTDRQLLSGVALSGIMAVLYSCLDLKATIGGKHHYLLYSLATAMKPRMLMTLDEDGAMLPVPVRVGQAVDVVAQAGRPKTITGFQTHTTPVLLSAGERAELASEQYIPLSPVLEGLVILTKNPAWVDTD